MNTGKKNKSFVRTSKEVGLVLNAERKHKSSMFVSSTECNIKSYILIANKFLSTCEEVNLKYSKL